MRVIPGCASALPFVLALGCAGGTESASPIPSDSSGVSLIQYDDELSVAAGPHQAAAAEPLFSVGEPAPELYQVRTARFLSDGHVVVANGGSQELILLDRAGRLLGRAGGEGEGPGEFRDLTSVAVGAGDSLFAFDSRQRRISVFDRAGRFVRSASLSGTDSIGRVVQVGILGNGSMVGAIHRGASGPGLVRDSLIVMIYDSSGEPVLRLGTFPHHYTHWGPHPSPGGGGTLVAPLPVPFSSMASVAAGAASVLVGLPENQAVVRLSLDGDTRITRQRRMPAALTEAHRERLFAALASGGRNPQELEVLRALQGPMTLPGFGSEPLTARVGEQALLVTDSEEVWIRPFQLPDDTMDSRWLRLDADGFYQGIVTMPVGCAATDVRQGVALAVCRDGQGVEQVRVYPLGATP